MLFFAIWWAWMNFTWFASAYDTDDNVYRLATLVQITGALTLAAGVPRAFDETDHRLVTYGYVIMRAGPLVAQWLRAARSDPERRRTALAYAAGIHWCRSAGWSGCCCLSRGTCRRFSSWPWPSCWCRSWPSAAA
jgi:low temperature requirement protein LtrA